MSLLQLCYGANDMHLRGRPEYGSLTRVREPLVNAVLFWFRPPCRRGGGGGVPRGGKGHGATGGPGAGRGPDHLLRHHLLLPHPGHALKQPTHTRRTNHGGAQGPDPRPPSPLRPRSVGGGGQRGGSTGIDRPMADLKEARG